MALVGAAMLLLSVRDLFFEIVDPVPVRIPETRIFRVVMELFGLATGAVLLCCSWAMRRAAWE